MLHVQVQPNLLDMNSDEELESSPLSLSSELSSPNEHEDADVLMEDGEAEELTDAEAGSRKKSENAGLKIICDCRACCSMGKKKWVSKSTRSRHRRRFAVNSPFVTATGPQIMTSLKNRIASTFVAARPQPLASSVAMPREPPVRESSQFRNISSRSPLESNEGRWEAISADASSMTPSQFEPSVDNGVDSDNSIMFNTLSRDNSHGFMGLPVMYQDCQSLAGVTLVNQNLDDLLNPDNFTRKTVDQPPKGVQLIAGPIENNRKRESTFDSLENITVTLFQNILTSLWSEFCV